MALRSTTNGAAQERELSKILFVAKGIFANGSLAILFLPLFSPCREYFADASQERSIEHAACHHELISRYGPWQSFGDDTDLRDGKERELSKILFVAEDAFANGSPPIHFLPLYSPYREYYADASEDRPIEHAACHHELRPRDGEISTDRIARLGADSFLAELGKELENTTLGASSAGSV
ncbi:unnamed protein product [Clonostachys rhizophaga]|uniref:Uncharacterized protein n=1 Tax=Clonostachys rhizophaga TaxID=160324 RepID=A0A9N9V4H0_9HYPO|nr:unnamed protein product [Clonostachys rhizophaga]